MRKREEQHPFLATRKDCRDANTMEKKKKRIREISNPQNEILIAGVRCSLMMSEPLLTLYWELMNIKNEGDAKEVEGRL